MKKRIISMFLVVLMVVSLLPTVAFAETGLTVTKANGDPAAEGTDYYYSGNALWIVNNGLAVTGTSSSTCIRIDDYVTNLKLSNVNLTGPYLIDVFEIINSDAFELILDGDNTLATYTSNDGISNYGILSDEGNLTISGSGTLSVTADSYAISTKGGLYVSSDACKIVARGGYAAINNNLSGSACIKTLAEGLVVTASTNKDALEADITGTAVYSGDCIKVGQTEAKAALIVKPAPAGHTHNFTYSASGATITATCTSGCTLDLDKDPESLTITEKLIAQDEFNVEDLTGWPFDGEGKPLTEIVPEINYYKADDLTTPLGSRPTEPGSYKVTVTFGSATAELEFTISEPHTHTVGEDTIPFEKEIKTFADLQDLFANGGSGYLAEDIDCTEALKVRQDVSLCLNGKMLNLAGKGDIVVDGFIKFNLYDCGNTLRNWDVDATGLWVPAAPASTTTNTTIGGVITGGSGDKGGGIYVTGKLYMYGGNIAGNTAAENGGGIFILGGGAVIMYDGNIVGNTAGNGGGIWMDIDDRLIMLGGSVTGNTATDQGGGIYYKGNACLAKGTMITLADGTRKPVEELDTGDDIRVFNHDTGKISHAKISDYWHYGEPKSDAFTLHFSNGIDVTAVTAHSFYEKKENRYVSLNVQNAESYIGHSFYNADADRWETLESVTLLNESVETYLVATEKHLDCITEGMLSCEDDIYTVFRNVFAFDKNMKVDKKQKAADIAAAGGLWSNKDCPLFTKESFDALNLKYAKVAVNKGMISFEDIEKTAVYCSILDTGHFESRSSEKPLALADQTMLMTAPEESSSIGSFTDLTFGGNAQVKDNVLKSGETKTANNIYLTSETVIRLATGTYAPEDTMFLCVSIEADSDSVPITGTAGTDDVKYFKADDPTYRPVYDTENSLINLEKLPSFYNVTAQVQGSHGQATVKVGEAEATSETTRAAKDASVIFTATPDSGYVFDYWEVVSGGITLTDADKVLSTLTVTMPDTALTLKAHFKAEIPSTYKIIVETDGHGTASANPTSAASGAKVTLSATPADGYAFKEWQIVRGLASDAITDNAFTMPANEVKIKAIFERVYNINIQNNGHGTVTASVNTAASGTSITLVPQAAEGYMFDKWEIVSGDFTIADNGFQMPASNVTIKAIFAEPVAAIDGTTYTTLTKALEAAKSGDVVKVLKNIETTDHLAIGDFVILDLNHKTVKTTGTITNKGSIRLYHENADIIDHLLYNVPGSYAAGEELKLPTADNPAYIVPEGTFVTTNVGDTPAYQQLDIAVFDGVLVWNADVPAGMQLDVTYSLTLGGDILGAKSDGIKPATVTANHVTLSDDITIGGNNGEGEASLVIESIHYEAGDPFEGKDVIGTFHANGKTITINQSGRLVISSDVTGFNEDMLVSGVAGSIICKSEDEETGTIIYTAGSKGNQTAPAEGEGYTVDRENGKIIPKEGYEIRAEIGKFDTKALPLRFGVPYFVRKIETDTLNPSPETKFVITEVVCEYSKTVELAEGTYGLKLGGKDKGEFTFEQIDGGWSIQNADGKYLAMKDGKLVLSDTAFAWTYKNRAFSASVKTTQKSSGYWFGFLYIPSFGGSRTVTTTYYLSTVTDGAKLSTCYTSAELYSIVSGEHDFDCWIDGKDGNHKRICKNCGEVETEAHDFGAEGTAEKCEKCGAFNPACKTIDVSATYKTKTQKQYVGFWPFGYYKNVTTYTATVTTTVTGAKVTKVEVSAKENGRWIRSTTFTSNSPIDTFYVRITTSDGNTSLFMVRNDGIGYPAN